MWRPTESPPQPTLPISQPCLHWVSLGTRTINVFSKGSQEPPGLAWPGPGHPPHSLVGKVCSSLMSMRQAWAALAWC